MEKSVETSLPPNSLLRKTAPSFDTEDCFTKNISGCGFQSAHELLQHILTNRPIWLDNLLLLRDFLLQPFGFKSPFTKLTRESKKLAFEKGSKFGDFELIAATTHALVFSFDDVPLTAHICVALSKDKSIASLSSRVIFHNRIGRLYFLSTQPFHKLVFKGLLDCLEKGHRNE